MASTIIKAILTASIALISVNAQATLTSYNPNGVDLVYSSVSNVTWTKDGNLLGSLFASQGFNTVVNAIIVASPTISFKPNFYNPTGTHNISISDFSSNGSTTWFGALAYVDYLNSISYSGSNQWYLPTIANESFGWNTSFNGNAKGDELGELLYTELNGTIYNPIPNTIIFDNEQQNFYWSGTQYAPTPDDAWVFSTSSGIQGIRPQYYQFYAWAVSPGQVTAAAVPEPENLAMLLAGLSLLGVAVRRNK
jgi:hypothetical protein